ncbi:MAG: hypothetical protein H0W50_01540 [Parachlamydiaceae bacterium]|nr:hypothetical protein [Parachlamydiaceae bacterium]
MDLGSTTNYLSGKILLNPRDAEFYITYVAATITTHTSDPKWAEAVGYKVLKPDDLMEIGNLVGLDARENCFFDLESSLKIVLLVKEKSLFITFGAKDSFYSEVEDDQKTFTGLRQLQQIASNITGGVPLAYRKAADFVARLKAWEHFHKFKLECVAQSFGGSIAQYVGLKYELPTVIFCSLAVGVGLQQDLGNEALLKANQILTHIAVAGDFISDSSFFNTVEKILSTFSIKTPANFGIGKIIPSAYPHDDVRTHGYVLGSFLKHAGLEDASTPEELQKILQNQELSKNQH